MPLYYKGDLEEDLVWTNNHCACYSMRTITAKVPYGVVRQTTLKHKEERVPKEPRNAAINTLYQLVDTYGVAEHLDNNKISTLGALGID